MCSGFVPLSIKKQILLQNQNSAGFRSRRPDLAKANLNLRIGTVTFFQLDRPVLDPSLDSSYTYSNSPRAEIISVVRASVNVEAIQSRKQEGSMAQLDGVVRLLKVEHDRLTKQMRGISAALSAFGAAYGKRATVRRKLSAAGRARIAEAQRQRWAKLRGDNGVTKSVLSGPKKRTMSAAARKRIAAAQRARWAKFKVAQRKAA